MLVPREPLGQSCPGAGGGRRCSLQVRTWVFKGQSWLPARQAAAARSVTSVHILMGRQQQTVRPRLQILKCIVSRLSNHGLG